MARVLAPAIETERLSAYAEEWFDETDVRTALADGLEDDGLLEHLGALACRRYRNAVREQTSRAKPIPRSMMMTERPKKALNPFDGEAGAHRFQRFTGRCRFADDLRFLAEVATWSHAVPAH